MSSKITNLEHTLDKLIAVYRNLTTVLEEELRHMAMLDLKALAEASHAKEVLLVEIYHLEQARVEIIQLLAPELGLDPATATMTAIRQKSGHSGKDLEQRQSVLRMMVERARDLNEKNKEFAQGSLERIEELKRNVLGLSSASSPENYSSQGNRQPVTEQGGRLLSTEA